MQSLPNILLDRIQRDFEDAFFEELSKWANVKLIVLQGNGEIDKKWAQTERQSDVNIFRNAENLKQHWVLNNESLRWFSNYEGVYAAIIARFNLYPSGLNTEDSIEIYYGLVNYWYEKVVSLNIEYCLSFFKPHDPSSFALYLVSKFLKIPYVYIDDPIIANRYKFLACSFSERNLLSRCGAGYAEDIGRHLEDFSKKILTKSSDAKPLYMIDESGGFSRKKFNIEFFKYLLNLILRSIRSIAKIVKSMGRRDQANWYMVSRRAKLSKDISIPSTFDLSLAKCRDRLKLYNRRREYSRCCARVSGKKYIYLAAPLLPEASNLPQAMQNRRLSFLLHYISESIPDDVYIAIKLNPAQFTTNQHWFNARSDWFGPGWFQDASSLYKNLIFVDSSESTLELISNSIGVASISGSVNYEALASGKRSIVISSNWYNGLDGIDLIGSVDQARDAISKMLLGIEPKPNYRKLFGDAGFVFSLENPSEGAYTSKDTAVILSAFKNAISLFDSLPKEKWSV